MLAANAAIVCRAVEAVLCVTIWRGIFDKWGVGWLRTADCWQTGVAVICMLEGLARAQMSVLIGLIMWT